MVDSSLDRRIRAAIERAGGYVSVAKTMSKDGHYVYPQLILSWINSERKIPAKWVIPLESALGGEVSRNDMRPDIYPDSKPSRES